MFKFFNKRTSDTASDFSLLQTDIHSHLIPGIDDGAQTMEQSLTLLRGLMDLGFTKVITTPHIRAERFLNTKEIIYKGLEALRNALSAAGMNIEVEAAAEHYLDDKFMDMLSKKELLVFGGNYMLFELSSMNEPTNISEIVFKLQLEGYKPVLAHPERYPYWYNNFEMYKKLRQQGLLFMLNTTSFTGYYGKAAKQIAQRLADHHLVDFLASDMHHEKHLEAMRKALSEAHVQKLMQEKLLNSFV